MATQRGPKLAYNPSTDDSYTDKDARKDRQSTQSVQKLSPEEGYKEYVTGPAAVTARLTANKYMRKAQQKKRGSK